MLLVEQKKIDEREAKENSKFWFLLWLHSKVGVRSAYKTFSERDANNENIGKVSFTSVP